MTISNEAVEKALHAHWGTDDSSEARMYAALEAAAPIIRAQALEEAVDAFPLETITAPDNAVAWLMERARKIRETPPAPETTTEWGNIATAQKHQENR